MLVKTTAQKKISKLRKRIRIVQGGTSSSKTFTIIPLLIDYAIKNHTSEISIVSESVPHLKRGAIKDFIKIMKWSGNWHEDNYNKSELKYTFSNGSYIEFFSVDQPDKLRGARRDILFINECNNIQFDAYQNLAIRTRKFIYLDYNPTSEFWVHNELMSDPDSCHVILTYKDNEALDKAIVKDIEKAREKAKTSKYWENWWRVYGLGLIGSLEGVIFDNWDQVDSIPVEARYVGSGMDFGYTADPTTLVDVFLYNDEYYFDEVLYERKLLNNQIHAKAKQFTRKDAKGKEHVVRRRIFADSAEPKSIDEIYKYGTNIQGADKGRDSIKFGINLLQQKKMHITKRSLNLIKELRAYVWAKDKTGKPLNHPVDYMNHLIDAMRYWAMMVLAKGGRMDIR